MMSAVILAIPSMNSAAAQGANAFPWIMKTALNSKLAWALLAAIVVAQYLCGLATLTSASRMVYAFARDGGLPWSSLVRRVSPTCRAPSVAIWTVAVIAILFMLLVPYATIAAICVMFLYISYVLPTAAGFFAHGRSWTTMGPWHVGKWYRPLAVLAVLGCTLLIFIGTQPPNQLSVPIVGGAAVLLAVAWFAFERRRFAGPPLGTMIQMRQAEIRKEEEKAGILESIHREVES
jgi:amino acid transporter